MDKQQHRSQPLRDKQRYHHLRLAKDELAHAKRNRDKMKAEGNEYAMHVYSVRIKALEQYIKTLQRQSPKNTGGDA